MMGLKSSVLPKFELTQTNQKSLLLKLKLHFRCFDPLTPSGWTLNIQMLVIHDKSSPRSSLGTFFNSFFLSLRDAKKSALLWNLLDSSCFEGRVRNYGRKTKSRNSSNFWTILSFIVASLPAAVDAMILLDSKRNIIGWFEDSGLGDDGSEK